MNFTQTFRHRTPRLVHFSMNDFASLGILHSDGRVINFSCPACHFQHFSFVFVQLENTRRETCERCNDQPIRFLIMTSNHYYYFCIVVFSGLTTYRRTLSRSRIPDWDVGVTYKSQTRNIMRGCYLRFAGVPMGRNLRGEWRQRGVRVSDLSGRISACVRR